MKITRTKRARIVSRDPEDFDCAVEMIETIELSDNLRPSIRFSNCTVEKDLIDDLIQNTLSTNSRAEFVFQNCNIKRKRRSSEIELAEKFDEAQSRIQELQAQNHKLEEEGQLSKQSIKTRIILRARRMIDKILPLPIAPANSITEKI